MASSTSRLVVFFFEKDNNQLSFQVLYPQPGSTMPGYLSVESSGVIPTPNGTSGADDIMYQPGICVDSGPPETLWISTMNRYNQYDVYALLPRTLKLGQFLGVEQTATLLFDSDIGYSVPSHDASWWHNPTTHQTPPWTGPLVPITGVSAFRLSAPMIVGTIDEPVILVTMNDSSDGLYLFQQNTDSANWTNHMIKGSQGQPLSLYFYADTYYPSYSQIKYCYLLRSPSARPMNQVYLDLISKSDLANLLQGQDLMWEGSFTIPLPVPIMWCSLLFVGWDDPEGSTLGEVFLYALTRQDASGNTASIFFMELPITVTTGGYPALGSDNKTVQTGTPSFRPIDWSADYDDVLDYSAQAVAFDKYIYAFCWQKQANSNFVLYRPIDQPGKWDIQTFGPSLSILSLSAGSMASLTTAVVLSTLVPATSTAAKAGEHAAGPEAADQDESTSQIKPS